MLAASRAPQLVPQDDILERRVAKQGKQFGPVESAADLAGIATEGECLIITKPADRNAHSDTVAASRGRRLAQGMAASSCRAAA